MFNKYLSRKALLLAGLASAVVGCNSTPQLFDSQSAEDSGQDQDPNSDSVSASVDLTADSLALSAAVVNRGDFTLSCDGIGPISMSRSSTPIPRGATGCQIRLEGMKVDGEEYAIDSSAKFTDYKVGDRAKFKSSSGGVLIAKVVSQLPSPMDKNATAAYSFARLSEQKPLAVNNGVVTAEIGLSGENGPAYTLDAAVTLGSTGDIQLLIKARCNKPLGKTAMGADACDSDPISGVKVALVDMPKSELNLDFFLGKAPEAKSTIDLKAVIQPGVVGGSNGGFDLRLPMPVASEKVLFLTNTGSSAFTYAKLTIKSDVSPSRSGFVLLNNPIAFDVGTTTDSEVLMLSKGVEDMAGFTTSRESAGSAFATAIAGKKAVILPEAERTDFLRLMDAPSKTALTDFVKTGGRLIVMQDGFTQNVNLINSLFGFSLQQQGAIGPGVLTSSVPFMISGAPTLLPNLNATQSIAPWTLPPSAIQLYGMATQSVATYIPVGEGSILILGYDWYNAKPMGTQASESWLALLRAAISN